MKEAQPTLQGASQQDPHSDTLSSHCERPKTQQTSEAETEAMHHLKEIRNNTS